MYLHYALKQKINYELICQGQTGVRMLAMISYSVYIIYLFNLYLVCLPICVIVCSVLTC